MTQRPELSIEQNVICELKEVSIIKITGKDANDFLQGQFSNDANALENGNVQFNSYNSPKGRMYASFYLTKLNDHFYMIIPTEISEMLLKRLRMFVMRSEVTLDIVDSQCYGFHGGQLIGQLDEKSTIPQDALSALKNETSTWIRMSTERLIGFGPAVSELIESLDSGISREGDQHWRILDIHYGIPIIYGSSQEEFVAQMVNLPQVGGVSFTKGCYPGQEVVARMHYLGKLKKRMYRINIQTDLAPSPAENIYEKSSENAQSIGQIVDAQLNESGSVDALAVLQIKSAEAAPLCLGSIDGPEIEIKALPYSIEE